MAGLEAANINEFIAHPDYQQTAAFFLGAVFITSLNYSSIWIRTFFPRFRKWISSSESSSADVENTSSDKLSLSSESSLGFIRPGEHHTLVFTLSLCFAFASIAYFGSLLSFSPNGGATCAFVVAWGGMAAQTAQLIGLVILLFEMRNLGIGTLEFYSTFALLFAAMVLVFVNNAIATGFLRVFKPLGIAICYRKHFMPTALATSLTFAILAQFILLRLGFLITRQATLATKRLVLLRDIRIAKALSLLFLEVLTIVPSALHITLLADFVPLCTGAFVVLVVFNYRPTTPSENLTLDSTYVPPASVSVAPGDPSLGHTGWLARRLSRSSSHRSNPSRASTSPDFPQPPTARIAHPFSAQYRDDTPVTWLQSRQRASMISPTETTFSTHEGIIQTVQRSGPPVHARAVVMAVHGIPKLSASLKRITDVRPLPVPPKPSTTGEPEASMLPVTSPSSALSTTSILMHPWYEKRQLDSVVLTSRFSTTTVDASDEGSKTPSTRTSEQASYMFRGPVPPMPSLAGNARPSSSNTTISPIFSEENGEGGQPRVQLLTFESNVRTGDRRAYSTPVPFSGSSVMRR